MPFIAAAAIGAAGALGSGLISAGASKGAAGQQREELGALGRRHALHLGKEVLRAQHLAHERLPGDFSCRR